MPVSIYAIKNGAIIGAGGIYLSKPINSADFPAGQSYAYLSSAILYQSPANLPDHLLFVVSGDDNVQMGALITVKKPIMLTRTEGESGDTGASPDEMNRLWQPEAVSASQTFTDSGTVKEASANHDGILSVVMGSGSNNQNRVLVTTESETLQAMLLTALWNGMVIHYTYEVNAHSGSYKLLALEAFL